MGKVVYCVLQDSGSQTRRDDRHVVLTIGDKSRFSYSVDGLTIAVNIYITYILFYTYN